jgi:hypothetical protein
MVYRPSEVWRVLGSASRIVRASHGSWWTVTDGERTCGAGTNGLSMLDPEPRVGGAAKGFSGDEKDGRRADGGRVLKFDGKDTGGGA